MYINVYSHLPVSKLHYFRENSKRLWSFFMATCFDSFHAWLIVLLFVKGTGNMKAKAVIGNIKISYDNFISQTGW